MEALTGLGRLQGAQFLMGLVADRHHEVTSLQDVADVRRTRVAERQVVAAADRNRPRVHTYGGVRAG